MGCHTWAYRKVKENEVEETKEAWISDLKSSFAYYEDEEEKKEKLKSFLEICEVYKDMPDSEQYTEETATKYLEDLNSKVHKAVESIQNAKTISDLAVLWEEEIIEFTVGLATTYETYNGELYILVGFDTPFRVYGYPEEEFTDAEEFISWLKETGREHTEKDDEEIREFWKKYDNEVYIIFG